MKQVKRGWTLQWIHCTWTQCLAWYHRPTSRPQTQRQFTKITSMFLLRIVILSVTIIALHVPSRVYSGVIVRRSPPSYRPSIFPPQPRFLSLRWYLRSADADADDDFWRELDIIPIPCEDQPVYGWVHESPKIVLAVYFTYANGERIVPESKDKVKVEAKLYLSGRRIQVLTLRDNGVDGDSASGDGIYSAIFYPPSVGTYTWQVVARLRLVRANRVHTRTVRSKELTFHVVPVPYAQITQPTAGAEVVSTVQVIASLLQLNKPFEQADSSVNATLIVEGDDYRLEEPLARHGAGLTAEIDFPRSGSYELQVVVKSRRKGKDFEISTETITLQVYKPFPWGFVWGTFIAITAILVVAMSGRGTKQRRI